MQVQAQPGSVAETRFHAVFDAELGWVCASLRRLGVYPRDIEDVAHDVFIEVWKKWESYDAARPLKPWLFAFAFRCASDYRRLARHRVEALVDHDVEASAPRADALLEQKDAERMLSLCLEKIDEERRGVFILYELDEVPMQDIAVALGIPVNTAYSRLRVAREEFQAAVARIHARKEGR